MTSSRTYMLFTRNNPYKYPLKCTKTAENPGLRTNCQPIFLHFLKIFWLTYALYAQVYRFSAFFGTSTLSLLLVHPFLSIFHNVASESPESNHPNRRFESPESPHRILYITPCYIRGHSIDISTLPAPPKLFIHLYHFL